MQIACCQGEKDKGAALGNFKTLPSGKKYYQTDSNRDKVVVLLTDVFGIKNLTNPLVIADKIYKCTGITVIVPDLFDGKEMVDILDDANKAMRDASIFFKLRSNIYAAYCLLSFIVKNSQTESLSILREHVTELKNQGVNSIGLLGYCWGGKVVLAACADKDTDEIVKCGVACHPGALSLGPITFPDCFKNQSKPMLYCLAEIDREIGPQRLSQIKDIAAQNSSAKEQDYQKVLYYPGTIHGFAARGEENNPVVRAAREDAIEKQCDFFKRHL